MDSPLHRPAGRHVRAGGKAPQGGGIFRKHPQPVRRGRPALALVEAACRACVRAPSPACGGGWGRGKPQTHAQAAPPPPPPPRAGGGGKKHSPPPAFGPPRAELPARLSTWNSLPRISANSFVLWLPLGQPPGPL